MVIFIQQQLSTKLKLTPDTFDTLKCVLGAISDIRDMSLDVEIRFTDIKERYRTLAMYTIQVLTFRTEHILAFDSFFEHLVVLSSV